MGVPQYIPTFCGTETVGFLHDRFFCMEKRQSERLSGFEWLIISEYSG